MSKPNFLYIGTDKAGSTWIYDYLCIHPEVYVPNTKELFFFDKYYSRGWDWYISHFKNTDTFKAIGEVSHDYIFNEQAAQRIKYHIPKVKLLCSFRNPIDRAVSQYLHMYRVGLVNLKVELNLKKYPNILTNSLYSSHLESYKYHFPKKSICILDFNILNTNPRSFVTQICKYLGIDYYFDNSMINKINPALLPRNLLFSKFGKKVAQIFRDEDMGDLLTKIKNNRTIKTIFFKTIDDEKKYYIYKKIKNRINNTIYNEVDYFKNEYGINFDKWINE